MRPIGIVQDELETDDDPREIVVWYLATLGAASAFVATAGWWAPRTWWIALTSHPGHGLAVARPSRQVRGRWARLAAHRGRDDAATPR